MKSTVVIAAVLSGWAGLALAQDEAPEPADALRLTIRPSMVEETRAERLARRSEQLDHAFRFICRGCSSIADPSKSAAAPFQPAEVLAKGHR